MLATRLDVIATLLMPLIHATIGLLMFEKTEFGENACLQAMCEVDSGCVPVGCSRDVHGRIGCGYFNINILQFRNCHQPGKVSGEDESVAWIRCAEDYSCSSECIRRIASRFRTKCFGKSDCETMARLHDGGANGCRTSQTAYYWKKVSALCGDNCKKPIFRRH